MDDVSSRDQLRPLLAALRELITPGVYAAALEGSPLVSLPAVTARAGTGAPRTARAQAFIGVLEDVIASRLSRTDKAAASILFAVGDWSAVPVRERHYEVARLRNKHWTWERNYRKEPLTRDLLTVLRALLREGDAPAPGASPGQAGARFPPGAEARAEAEFHVRRLGRRRTAYPLDMSLEELVRAGLAVPARLGSYHERQVPGPARHRALGEVVRCLAEGRSVLLLGEPGAGKTLAMYQLAAGCADAGMLPVPVRARETAAVLARTGWAALRDASTQGVAVLLDSLDEAADVIARDRGRFAADLSELLSVGPYVVSSRVRDYEELASTGFPDPGFDAVFVLQPWTLEGEFRDYMSRLADAGLLDEPVLYEAVIGSEDLSRLVTRPLYARMLTFVGERAARSLRDHHELYGEYLARLARATEHDLGGGALPAGGALALWQATAWVTYAAGNGTGDAVPLADAEEHLSGALPRATVRRVLDQVIERGSSHGRETGEFIHYSFYECLLAREVRDRLLRNPSPAEIAELLRADLPREVRHHLIGQLRVAGDASLRSSLFASYDSVRHVLDLPERHRLAACNLLIYLISRASDDCADWLRGQLAGETVLFLRHAMLWAMCHAGSAWALREFSDALETSPAMRSECRGYTLYYYGDLPRDAGPPYLDATPEATGCALTRQRITDMFARADFAATVPPERRYIDLYTFLDILAVRGIFVDERDTPVIRRMLESLHSAGLPASLLSRLTHMASRAGVG